MRTYKPDVRKRVLAALDRMAKGEALVSCAPKEPLVKVTRKRNVQRSGADEAARRKTAQCSGAGKCR